MRKIIEHLRAEWYKYVLEILVITIGILGAYVLNNWNESRKDNETEKLTLERLKDDLKADTSRFAYLDYRFKERITKCDSVLEILPNLESSESKISTLAVHTINFFLAEANTTTYEEMLNTGRLYSMNDKQLREAILDYYRNVSKWSTYIKQDNQQLRDQMAQATYNDYWVIQRKVWADEPLDMNKYRWITDLSSREWKDIESLVYATRELFNDSKGRVGYLKRHAGELLKELSDNTELDNQ